MYRKALIWGATGFIGQAVLRHLRQRGEALAVLTRRQSHNLFASDVEVFETGIARAAESREVIRGAVRHASCIYNLAGSSGAVASNRESHQSFEDNCLWQLDFLEACAEAGHRPHVVFASSRLVYGRPLTASVDESHPLDPTSMYAVHKLCVEHYHRIYARQQAITACICRMSIAFGRDSNTFRKEHGFLNTLIERGRNHSPLTLFGDGSQLRDYIYIEDLARALVSCGSHPAARNEVFNLGSGEGVSLAAAATEIGRLTGSPVLFQAWPEAHSRVETGDFVSNISKARRLLGFSPRYSFVDGLRAALFNGMPRAHSSAAIHYPEPTVCSQLENE